MEKNTVLGSSALKGPLGEKTKSGSVTLRLDVKLFSPLSMKTELMKVNYYVLGRKQPLTVLWCHSNDSYSD
jgi:hypothetical protein